MTKLSKYSLGIGDRFGRQGEAQLAALQEARALGIDITPVWNKSFREHRIIGSTPTDSRRAADAAVAAAGWQEAYFVDADHIGLQTVDGFLDACDYFTLDVAAMIGQAAAAADQQRAWQEFRRFCGSLAVPGLLSPLPVTEADLQSAIAGYLAAVQEAGRIYRRIAQQRADRPTVIEVSMDETARPQSPAELFFILAMLDRERVPVQTIAPRFSGAFHKGVDYIGDVDLFGREFAQHLAAVQAAIKTFDLRADLKLSLHSGSDKFAIYGCISTALQESGAGLHVKTAGTTWLEEIIGLAQAGGEGLDLAKEIACRALLRQTELCAPYSEVIDIDPRQLPTVREVRQWDSEAFVAHTSHRQQEPCYNPMFRQLLHVAYGVAAEMGETFYQALDDHRTTIAAGVQQNLFEHHVRPLFLRANV